MDPLPRLNAALEGRYLIERELGQGGMATVYLADDLRHERKVALKVLKPELAAAVGADRFLAEIKTTANLQHPHILPLYDSGEADSLLFYVMPYVEGESLRERLDREHQLPVDDAVRVATNMAEALDYAHRHGVVHRDIKPANVLLQDGKPVISDFGIALAVGTAGGGRLTETGLSLGTPHYMSPEQATGDLHVGPPTDIWALGCVLYEMLVGEPPFTGSTAQAVLGKIITAEPQPVHTERRAIPPNVEAVVARALEKVPADRFTSAGQFAAALSDLGFRHNEERTATAASRYWKPLSLGLAATTVLLLGMLVGARSDRPAPAQPLQVANPFLADDAPGALGSNTFDLSDDGSMLVYRGGALGRTLMLRRWEELRGHPLRDTERADNPVISPNGLEVAFDQAGVIKVLTLAAGRPRALGPGVYPRWGGDGFVYAVGDSGAVRYPVQGGEAEYVSRLSGSELFHAVEQVLPGEDKALLVVSIRPGEAEIRALDLPTGETTRVTEGFQPRYLPTGHLVYGAEPNRMMAVEFDLGDMEPVGVPRMVVDSVRSWTISATGTLFYSTLQSLNLDLVDFGTIDRVVRLMWVSRDGVATPIDPDWTVAMGDDNATWRVSPDGSMLVLAQGRELWVKRLDDGPLTRLSPPDGARAWRPSWVPNSSEVTYGSNVDGNMDIWQRDADAVRDPMRILDFDRSIAWIEWSPNREWIVFQTSSAVGIGGTDIYGFRPGRDSAAVPLLVEPRYSERVPVVSPNGRFLAIQSNETGRGEVWVHPFPDVDAGRFPVSRGGGKRPEWAHSGTELFFQGPDATMMVVDVDTSGDFEVGVPRVLFEADPGWVWIDPTDPFVIYDVALDDQRFVVAELMESGEDADVPYTVLRYNWFEELKSLVPN